MSTKYNRLLFELNERVKEINECINFYENTGYDMSSSDGYESELKNLDIINNDIDLLESNPKLYDIVVEKYIDSDIALESGLSGLQLQKHEI